MIGTLRLPRKERQQRCGQADRTEEVGDDCRLRVGEVVLRRLKVLGPHDAGVVDEHVQLRMLRGDLRGEGADRVAVLDIESERGHAGVGGRGFVEH